MSLSYGAQEAVWLRQLLSDLQCAPEGPTTIFEDNQSAVCIAQNSQFHKRTKHMYHFVREQVDRDNIKIVYCRTEDM